jgi:hypothetical protein
MITKTYSFEGGSIPNTKLELGNNLMDGSWTISSPWLGPW